MVWQTKTHCTVTSFNTQATSQCFTQTCNSHNIRPSQRKHHLCTRLSLNLTGQSWPVSRDQVQMTVMNASLQSMLWHTAALGTSIILFHRVTQLSTLLCPFSVASTDFCRALDSQQVQAPEWHLYMPILGCLSEHDVGHQASQQICSNLLLHGKHVSIASLSNRIQVVLLAYSVGHCVRFKSTHGTSTGFSTKCLCHYVTLTLLPLVITHMSSFSISMCSRVTE